MCTRSRWSQFFLNNIFDTLFISTFRLNDRRLEPLVLQQGWIWALLRRSPPHGQQLSNRNGARSFTLVPFPRPKYRLRTPHRMVDILHNGFALLLRLLHLIAPCLPREFPNSEASLRPPSQRRNLGWASKDPPPNKECCKASDLLFVWCQMFGYCTEAGCVWARSSSQ